MKLKAQDNPAGIRGLAFIEYASPDPGAIISLWQALGFVHQKKHKTKQVELFIQNHIYFVLNREKSSFAESFALEHGPGVCALGFLTQSADKAFEWVLSQGAKAVPKDVSHSFPAIFGIGGSIIYFVDEDISNLFLKNTDTVSSNKNLLTIDHLTHNVPLGEMQNWCDFYHELFNFTQRRYFDIRGEQTGLVSKVMRSPCNTITIPINEPAEGIAGEKSQIKEFIDEFKGAGVQHIALSSKDIIHSVKNLRLEGLDFLKVPMTYYENLAQRCPNIKESYDQLQEQQILADGDDKGYLLQIFTKNVIGPLFYEIIQRHHHDGFGEGNFKALFVAIEKDQMQRGYLSK